MTADWSALPLGGLEPLSTEFGDRIDPDAVLQEYPRPQLRRDSYVNLNGWWDYSITRSAVEPDQWDGRILVPFSPEAPLSGVGRQVGPGETLHYRRTFAAPARLEGWRVLAQFGAVDQRCAVYVNGKRVGAHRGGYLPFGLDITDALGEGDNELRVVVRDDTDECSASRGKQKTERGGIWYTPFSGIWQTVWLEAVPPVRVERLHVVPRLARGTLEVTVFAKASDGVGRPGFDITRPPRVEIELSDDATTLRASGRVGSPIAIELPRPHLWTPDDPHLYSLSIRLGDDRVESYAAMRSVSLGRDFGGIPRLELNGRPYFYAGLLDQGYWPDGIATPPSDDAMANDIELAKRLGFTMLRKHIKIEPLRWYHHCDRLGMLVWQDMVNGGGRYQGPVVTAPVVARFHLPDHWRRAFAREDAEGRADYRRETVATVRLLQATPSVVCWVPFNEGWGQFDALAAERAIRSLDPTRLVDHASGWHDQGGGDMTSRHVYFTPVRAPRVRRRAFALTEYGGYALRVEGHTASPRHFGYRTYDSVQELTDAFCELHARLADLIPRGLAATVYTQLTDVEDEVNGVVTYDRRVVKVDEDRVREALSRLRLP